MEKERLQIKMTQMGIKQKAKVKALLSKPPIVKLKDRVFFCGGVLLFVFTEGFILYAPEKMSRLYTIVMVTLYSTRYYLYTKIGWLYFMVSIAFINCEAHALFEMERYFSTRLLSTFYSSISVTSADFVFYYK